MKESSIIKLAAEAGKIILENGGETYRVEETINRICYSYEVEFVESFVTPTGIMVSTFTSGGENISVIRRIKNSHQFKTAADSSDEGWRGEFWGKMMRGASLVYSYIRDDELYCILKNTVINSKLNKNPFFTLFFFIIFHISFI